MIFESPKAMFRLFRLVGAESLNQLDLTFGKSPNHVKAGFRRMRLIPGDGLQDLADHCKHLIVMCVRMNEQLPAAPRLQLLENAIDPSIEFVESMVSFSGIIVGRGSDRFRHDEFSWVERRL